MAGLYFEEFEVGREFHHEFSRTVTEMDNTMFSLLTMNPQPLHIDAHFSEYGFRISLRSSRLRTGRIDFAT